MMHNLSRTREAQQLARNAHPRWDRRDVDDNARGVESLISGWLEVAASEARGQKHALQPSKTTAAWGV